MTSNKLLELAERIHALGDEHENHADPYGDDAAYCADMAVGRALKNLAEIFADVARKSRSQEGSSNVR
jgi:hypothetical protein